MRDPTSISVEQLLQHRAWVRSLAGTLVRDEATADDLEQQTWMAALKKPPRGNRPKAWLGQVVRNLAARARRREYRVDMREKAAARGEHVPGTADIVAEAELHKRVVEAVLDLDPPHRAAVLLRHYEGLPLREVARRMGVGAETARSRVRRGLRRVREQLDRVHGGDGHTWRHALLPLVLAAEPGAGSGTVPVAAATSPGTGAGALGTGALLMATQTKVALAALLLLLLAGATWMALGNEEAEQGRAPIDVVQRPGDGEPESGAGGGTEPLSDGTPIGDEKQQLPPAMRPGDAWVRVVYASARESRTAAGARVRVATPNGRTASLRTDAWGRALVPTSYRNLPATVWVTDLKTGAVARRSALFTEGEFVVRLPRPREIEIRFVDAAGRPLPAEIVRRRYEAAGLVPRVQLISVAGLSSRDTARALENMLGLSDGLTLETRLIFEEQGVRLAAAPGEERWHLLVERPGAQPELTDALDAGQPGGIALTLPLPEAPKRTRVRVVDVDDGQALPGALVTPYFQMGNGAAYFAGSPLRTDHHGEVDVPHFESGRSGRRPPSWWVTTKTHATLVDPARAEGPDEAGVFVIRAWRTATVKGKAWQRNGQPAVGRLVTAGTHGRRVLAVVDTDGRYRLEGVALTRDGRAAVRFIENLEAVSIMRGDVQTAPGGTFHHDFGEPGQPQDVASLTGRITAGGAPLANVMMFVARVDDEQKSVMGRTDKDGRYELKGVRPGANKFVLLLGNVRVSYDFIVQRKEPLVLRAGDRIERDFAFDGGVVELVVVDDATGTPVSAAAATARPMDREFGRDKIEGFQSQLGWADRADDQGLVRLRALPHNVPLQVDFWAPGYERGKRDGVSAGTRASPTRLKLRLKKKQ